MTSRPAARSSSGISGWCMPAPPLQREGIEYEDLFQAGCIGLIKAADAFDTGRGVRFSTYAVPVILGEMRRLFRDGGAVKISRTIKELSLKVSRARERFCYDHGREATISELAQLLEVSEEAVVEALGVCSPPVSLTESEENGGGSWDLPVESPEELTGDLIALRQALDLLEERDRTIISDAVFWGKDPKPDRRAARNDTGAGFQAGKEDYAAASA